MKDIRYILLAISILFISACSTTTITDKPGNYKYKENETINIIDIDSRETIGTIVITGAEILKNEPFTVQESDGADENGNTQYKDVTYNQIVQIYYKYTVVDSSKKIRGSNFDVYDSKNERGAYPNLLKPEPKFNEKAKKGNLSFTIALENAGDYIDIDFNYNMTQTKSTAKIRIDL